MSRFYGAQSEMNGKSIGVYMQMLFRVGDLDLSVDQRKQSSEELVEDALWHPFLSFFISLLVRIYLLLWVDVCYNFTSNMRG